jgi:TRAP-type mannitol/chloroaromatic compound transport system substrate-binding protein
MGFPDVAKFYLQQSYHMANNFTEVMFNKDKHEALPAEVKAVLKYVAHAAHADMSWKNMHRMSQDFIDVQLKDKVKVYRTPRAILDAQLKAWDAVVAKRSGENPLFAKVIASQKAWARRVMYWHNSVQVNQQAAYQHYFPKGALAG